MDICNASKMAPTGNICVITCHLGASTKMVEVCILSGEVKSVINQCSAGKLALTVLLMFIQGSGFQLSSINKVKQI